MTQQKVTDIAAGNVSRRFDVELLIVHPSLNPAEISQENGAMTRPRRSNSRLFVIVDPEYGRRLLEIEPGWPVWITMSPTNKPVVYSLWQTCPEPDHLTGTTGFQFDPDIGPDERFLAQLRTIDVHHGAYSSSNPYTELEVIGTPLTVAIREALSQLGFSKFTEGQDCFVATHSGDHLSSL